MQSINELLKLGYDFKLNGKTLEYDFLGIVLPDINIVKPLFNQVALNKEQAHDYIKSLIKYEIPIGINFDFQVKVLQLTHNVQ